MKALLLALVCLSAQAQRHPDPRLYCDDITQVKRDAKGFVVRSEAAKKQFAKWWPCPTTGEAVPECPGWSIDHVIPLAVCGADVPANMQWLPDAIKSCDEDQCKDRWERKAYARPQMKVPVTWEKRRVN